jgi:hypothetical protein
VSESSKASSAAVLGQRVAAHSAWSYEASGLEAIVGTTHLSMPAVFIPALNRLEAIVTEGQGEVGALQAGFASSLHGEVWVLAPLSLMGYFHAALRGRVDRIVPWWVDAQIVKFGAPEIP